MRKIYLLFIGLLTFLCLSAQPKTEVRAVWLTTNYTLDWPQSVYDAAKQQKNLQTLLDQLQAIHVNTILFQVQCRSDVFWESAYQPWSRFITGTPGKTPEYDVLQFVIDQCRARNMEIHAWVVPYPVGADAVVNLYGDMHVVKRRPDLCVKFNNLWFLDPGLPATTEYLVNLYSELVDKYDFDGINLDYTRYEQGSFPDDNSYATYGKGMTRANWRRQNINNFVHTLYDMIVSKKPDMKLGAAPIGAYESLPNASSGFTARDHVWQDPVEWMSSGKLDIAYPQVYWVTNYQPQLANWIAKSSDRPIIAGLAAYKMLPPDDGENWPASNILTQIDQARTLGAGGVCFFRNAQITDNYKGIYTSLQTGQFRYPSNIPPMPWRGVSKPGAPQNVSISKTGADTYTISWDEPVTDANAPIKYYCVYTSGTENVDISDVKNLAAHYVKGRSIEYTVTNTSKNHFFTVTAFDKGYYESDPSDVVSTSGTPIPRDVIAQQVRFVQSAGCLNINSEIPVYGLHIYSVTGVLVYEGLYNDRHVSVETGFMNRGIYIVVVRLENGAKIKYKMLK